MPPGGLAPLKQNVNIVQLEQQMQNFSMETQNTMTTSAEQPSVVMETSMSSKLYGISQETNPNFVPTDTSVSQSSLYGISSEQLHPLGIDACRLNTNPDQCVDHSEYRGQFLGQDGFCIGSKCPVGWSDKHKVPGVDDSIMCQRFTGHFA